MTKKLYLENTYQFSCESLILETGEDEKGIFIILDQTVFYPQGGGQPSDEGLIKNETFNTKMCRATQINDAIRHYINDSNTAVPIGEKVYCFINEEKRLCNARYHTAAHLLGNTIEILYPSLKAIKGHSFPGQAYVEFLGNEKIDSAVIQEALNQFIEKNDKTRIFEIDPVSFEEQFYQLPYSIPANKKFRVMQIGSLLPVPCGGTHLSSLGEIKHVLVKKIKEKNNIVHISYEVP